MRRELIRDLKNPKESFNFSPNLKVSEFET